MSAQDPSSEVEFLTNLPIPWLVGGPWGQREATANGQILDQQIALIKLATKARFPDYAPTDALPHIGGDRQLEQGPNETNTNFVTRLKAAWDDWARAGTALELLVQLYWGGFAGAVLAQQNGLLYSLSGPPTAGVDPTSLLQINLGMPNFSITQVPGQAVSVTCTVGGTLGVATFQVTSNGAVFGSFTPPSSPFGYPWYPIPGTYLWLTFRNATFGVGDTWSTTAAGAVTSTGSFTVSTYSAAPWCTIDANNAHASRFVVLFPGSSFGTGSSFVTSATVTFTGSENGTTIPWPTATWNNAFADTSYKVLVGAVYSSQPVGVSADGTTKTRTGIGLVPTGGFAGTVDVLAWEAGSNPFSDIHANDLARLRRLIGRWRPAKAICAGIYQIPRLPVWDYPTSTGWDQPGLNWDSGSSVAYGA